MMKKVLLAALLVGAAATLPAQAQTKKELVQRLIATQQSGLDGMVRSLVERPAQQMMASVAPIVGNQVPADKREAVSKQIETAVKKYLDEAVPLVRAEALKLTPSIAAIYEEKFTDDELKTIVAWMESPANKKLQQVFPEIQNTVVQKLVPASAPSVDPKLKDLEAAVRTAVGPYVSAAPANGSAPATPAKPKGKASAKQ